MTEGPQLIFLFALIVATMYALMTLVDRIIRARIILNKDCSHCGFLKEALRQMTSRAMRAENNYYACQAEILEMAGKSFPKTKKVIQNSFSSDEIKNLIKLVHPDRHSNSPLATEMTVKLLAMRNGE